jgi:hypothetical protein
MSFLPGYLALSVGVAERDRQAGVGAVWVGWWESSKTNQPGRRAFASSVGERKKIRLEVADGRKSGGVVAPPILYFVLH